MDFLYLVALNQLKASQSRGFSHYRGLYMFDDFEGFDEFEWV